jgi:hypothetical protein
MIMFYAADRYQTRDNIQRLMVEYQADRPVIPFNSLDALESRLRRPHHDLDIILICVGDAIEMVKLTRMRSLLIDSRIVMVLPYYDADMVAWAHKLGPRFIAYADSSEQQIGSVLHKMLEKKRGGDNCININQYRENGN